MTRRYGCLPDKVDTRDKLFASPLLPADLPIRASVRDTRTIIRDQGRTGSCVGQAVSSAVRIAYLAGNGADCPDLSSLFAYYNARELDGGDITDDGTTIRNGIKGAQLFGAAPTSIWPFDPDQVNAMPPWRAFRAAHDRRGIRGYYRITSGDVIGVKQAIAARCPVVGGWLVNERFVRHTTGILNACQAPYLGGHAMVVEAYDGDVFTLLNSWGTGWGERGRARVTAEFIAEGRDLWAINV